MNLAYIIPALEIALGIFLIYRSLKKRRLKKITREVK